MAGGFNPIDPAQCVHYASFAAHLGRRAFDVIYWLLFILVIFMLFLAAFRFSGDSEIVSKLEPGSREYKNRMRKCMCICSLYASISVVSVVMEVFALMALQFCDGEDLMSLYWSTWTMMQVGSLIAIFGILLSVFNGLRGNKNPPWALALGTPVLVVAGLGHAVHGAMRKRVQRVRSRSLSRQRGMSVSSNSIHQSERVLTSTFPISREDTIRGDDSEREDGNESYQATLLGFTPEGAPILMFADDPGAFRAERGAVIGRGQSGQVIVAFKKSMMTIIDSSNSNINLVGTSSSSLAEKYLSPSPPGSENNNDNNNGLLAPPVPTIPPQRPPVVRIAEPAATPSSPV
ncbi:hypothetical protein B0H63DRAFT_57951 [Podospora didyma]|uniref:Transmembrane protein n=1 Tax=Podospora didyma TaxID=330526 RepID=A0AAE0P7F9_9PEZI|nr:hypothetical protein B0H63DRAFT_57951 [Podospora didyma]